MVFKPGDMVWILRSFDRTRRYEPPALVISAYQAEPKIFLSNPEANTHVLEQEDVGEGWVYDILHNGELEVAIRIEWLVPFIVEPI